MNKKNYLIYLDILGFGDLAKEIASKKGIDYRDVRKKFIDVIKERVEIIEAKSKIIGKNYGGSDDWLLVVDTLDKAFNCIYEILDHNTGYENYEKISLEIAIGSGEYAKWARFDGTSLIVEESTIYFFKTKIIDYYRELYKKILNQSVKSSFVILTESAYNDLELQDKKICKKLNYNGKENVIPLFDADVDKVKKRGKIVEFLEKIGSHRVEYREIEELYVEPRDFNKIKSTLEKHNIVFIVGDAEMGKTYTAIRLLWEYYSKDYEPMYIPEERKKEQWGFIRHRIEFENKAIYFEDPWGKVEFEKVDSLFRDVGIFIEEAKRQNCKIIITSREKVFNEFEKRKETVDNLWDYVTLLKVNLGYDKKNLVEMLQKYIRVFEPLWNNDNKIIEVAFQAVEDKLATPMSIKRLIDYSKNAKDVEGLIIGIEKAAEESKITFAKEIKEMFYKGEYDKLIFLSFAYIGVNYEVAKSCYEETLADLSCNLMKVQSFDMLLEKFDEVEISSYGLKYVHPSYLDAFRSALTDGSKPNNICTKIYSNVLLKLFEKEEDSFGVSFSIAQNFNILPGDVRNVLFKLSENEIGTLGVALAIASNFDKLPGDVRNLLFKLSETKNGAQGVVFGVIDNFNVLPGDVRNLLFKLSERNENAMYFAWAIEEHFDLLPEDVRNKILLNISEKDSATNVVLRIMKLNFNKISYDVRNRLLLNLSEKFEDTKDIATWFEANNFDKLNEG